MPDRRATFSIFTFLLVSPLLFGCDSAKPYRYTAPTQTSDGWDTSSIGSEGIGLQPITDLIERINDGTYKNIHSVLVTKNGKLVVEVYFPGSDSNKKYQLFDRDTLHELHSVTKSVNSILVGIAIDQHLIAGVESPISLLYPAYSDVLAENGKSEIRLKDLLTMRAGLSWDEWTYSYGDARNDHVAMNSSKDPVRYVFERPMVGKPGDKFAYSSGITIALGEAIHLASGINTDKFAEQHLFEPLGISNFYWWTYPSGFVQTGGGLCL